MDREIRLLTAEEGTCEYSIAGSCRQPKKVLRAHAPRTFLHALLLRAYKLFAPNVSPPSSAPDSKPL